MNNQMDIEKIDALKVGDISPTKFAIELIADEIIDAVDKGEVNALEIAIKMNAISQVAARVKENIKDNVLDELWKFPQQKSEIHGAKIELICTTKYNFFDAEGWSDLEAQKIQIELKQKEIEKHYVKFRRKELQFKESISTVRITLKK